MAVLLAELQERLIQQYSEVDVLELLNISVEDLVNRFEDRVEERFDYLLKELDMGEDVDEV